MGKPASLHNTQSTAFIAGLAEGARRLILFSILLLGALLRLTVQYWEFPSTVLWFTLMILAAKAGWIVNGVWLLPLFFILTGRAIYHRCSRFRRRRR